MLDMTVSDKKYHGMAVFQPVINGKIVGILCPPTHSAISVELFVDTHDWFNLMVLSY